MAERTDIHLDRDCIEPDRLQTYRLEQFAGPVGDPPVVSYCFEGVEALSPEADSGITLEYDVELEYQPARGGRSLLLESITEYLDSFRESRMTEEAMAQAIRTHVMQVLDLDNMFVEVVRKGDGVKRSRLGQP